jgi:hypothetical protein
MTEYTPLKYNKRELALLVLPVASLIISCAIVSSKKPFWFDELFSYYFLSDPSFSHMLTAFHDKINNTPILYFFLGWFWDKIFGSSELSYRLFSSITFCAALISVWTTLRRRYNFWPTTIGTLAVFCTSSVILNQNAEARMYGLFLVVTALAFRCYDNFHRKQNPTFKGLVINAGIHIAIIHTHLFGPFYSGAILVALMLADRYLKVWRPKIYLSIVLSWLTFLLYLPSFLIQADVGKPRTWLLTPGLQDLIDFYNLSVFVNSTTFAFLLLVSGLHLVYKQRFANGPGLATRESSNTDSNVPAVLFACVFFVVPVFVWIFSRTVKAIFWDRYMIPSALGVIILLADVTSRLISTRVVDDTFRKNKVGKAIRFLMIPAGLIGLAFYLLWQPIRFAKYYEGSAFVFEDPVKGGLPDVPIVVQNSSPFVMQNFYSPQRDKYFYILDWEAAVNKHSGTSTPGVFKHFTALKKLYPERFGKNILTTVEFLAKYDRFIVVTDGSDTLKCPENPIGLALARRWFGALACPQWVAMRLRNNPAYKLTYLTQTDYVTYLLVEKQSEKL